MLPAPAAVSVATGYTHQLQETAPAAFGTVKQEHWPDLQPAMLPDQIRCMGNALTLLLGCAAVKQGAKVAGRVYEAPRNHVGRAPPQQCFTFQGPTRFGAVVLTQIAGFNPKLVRQQSPLYPCKC